MTVTVYRSTDASAPVLSGSAGALAGVLDACLVTGYGAKAAAGWAIEFTGTNLRAYRAATGNRFRLRLDDTGTSSCRVVGYESMTDINTGTGDFPTAAQVSGGLYWTKSATADATARPWLVIATGTFAYVLINTNSSGTSPTTSMYCFGDFTSYKSGDAYNTVIVGSTAAAHAVATSRGYGAVTTPNGAVPGFVGHYIARAYNAVAGAVQCGKLTVGLGSWNNPGAYIPVPMGSSNTDFGGTNLHAAGTFGYPETVAGGCFLSPVLLIESAGLRGKFPGFWAICTTTSLGNHHDTFTGTGTLAGKTFDLYKWTVGALSGQVAYEISDTW